MKLTIPWTSTAAAGALGGTTEVLLQVSRLELQRRRDVPGFVLAALRLRRDVLRADGAVGVSLIAEPGRRTFWTLSAWTDRDAITAFTRSAAHRAVMQRYRDRMRGSHFHTWSQAPVEALPPGWTAATKRFEESLTAVDGDLGR